MCRRNLQTIYPQYPDQCALGESRIPRDIKWLSLETHSSKAHWRLLLMIFIVCRHCMKHLWQSLSSPCSGENFQGAVPFFAPFSAIISYTLAEPFSVQLCFPHCFNLVIKNDNNFIYLYIHLFIYHIYVAVHVTKHDSMDIQ